MTDSFCPLKVTTFVTNASLTVGGLDGRSSRLLFSTAAMESNGSRVIDVSTIIDLLLVDLLVDLDFSSIRIDLELLVLKLYKKASMHAVPLS